MSTSRKSKAAQGRTPKPKVRKATAVVAASLLASSETGGCAWHGLNSLPLPGTEGTGDGSYRVYVQMPDVTTLTPNSPVKVNDVTVGTVSGIEVQNWHALLTVSLNPGVELPANAVARIGQTSLLGSTHVSLSAPDAPAKAQGRLAPGATIPLERAGVYPTTEQTLSALSVVLNGGGFSSLGDIVKELDTALSGREDKARDLLSRLTTLTTELKAQKGNITTALAGLDRLGQVFAGQSRTLSAALDKVPPALNVLVEQRQNLTSALTSLGQLSDTASQVIGSSGKNLQDNLHSLTPLLTELAKTGHHITGVLSMLAAFPFPLKTYKNVLKGDYLNLWITYEITPKRMNENFFTGTALTPPSTPDRAAVPGPPAPQAQQPAELQTRMTDPFRGPLNLLPAPPPAPKAPGPQGGR
ncbi:MAG: MCE family protein [Mycobacteriaceae bacterium]|nr:MCE family protein [Mycobacteriaceae bacterium]